ncbi:MAG: flagellar M-ring protein FliF [Myxococcales bacterium]|nr:flagellar M-ring protein FliF [Myxococcales bacterium]
MASLREIPGQLKNLWTQLSTGKKISFILIFLLMTAIFSFLVWWAGRAEYKTLYADLAVEDANAVVSHLKENRIPYKLDRDGTSISVPDKNYYEAKMSLANAGLPSGGVVGYELFDRKGLGLTDAQLKIAKLRALQGELARTIKELSPVEACRVHLALPEETLFIEDKKQATASVVLTLAANAKLTDEQISGIVFLVSSSVEGLDSNNVTIIDQKGHVLSKPKDDAMGGAGDLEDKTRKLEKQTEQNIETLLARSVGPEKVAARVHVVLDRENVQKVEERYNPDEQVVRSQQTVVADNTASETNTSSFPGAESNVPETNYAEGAQNQSKSNKKQETVNYEISRTTSTISQAGGAIKKLSVAVLIDGTYKEVEGEGKKKMEFVPRSEEEMATFTEIVKKVVGYNEQRGDQIEVANIPFVTEEAGALESPYEKMDYIIRFVNYGLAVLGVVLFLLFIVRPLLRWLTTEPSLESQLGMPAELLAGATVGEIEARLAGRLGPGVAAEEAVPAEEAGPKEITMAERMGRLNRQKADLLETASRDSEAVTLMIRRWIKEGERNA